MKTDRNMEDMALLSSLRKGEQQAFDSLFRKYYPMLCAYARRFVELEDAEEIVQEIMLWIWEKHSELIIESSLSQYLFKMTYHRALNLIAKKEIINRAEAVFYTKNQEMPEDVNYYQIKELTKRIEKAIAALPESYQTAFIMHRFKGMSYKDIAVTYNVSPKTIDYRIQQALKLLREDLKDYLPVFHIYPGVSFPHSSLDNTLGGIGDLADRDRDLQDICFRIFDRGGEGFLVRTEVDDGLDP